MSKICLFLGVNTSFAWTIFQILNDFFLYFYVISGKQSFSILFGARTLMKDQIYDEKKYFSL